ncbi:9880_t:CDS:2 [Funneliformis geosporum]|nr:9880_t:CDS:2 [Funneliformis geosporum]
MKQVSNFVKKRANEKNTSDNIISHKIGEDGQTPYQKSCVDGPHLIGDLTELQGLTSPRGRTQQRAKSLVKKLPWQLTEDAEPTLGRTHPSRGASSLHTVHIYTKSTNLSMLKAYKPCYKL